MCKKPVDEGILLVLKLNPYLCYNCLEKLCLLVQNQAVEACTPPHAVSLLRLVHCFLELWCVLLGLYRNSSSLWAKLT